MREQKKTFFLPFSVNAWFRTIVLVNCLFAAVFFSVVQAQAQSSENKFPVTQNVPDSITRVLLSTQHFSAVEKDFGSILAGDTAFVTFTFTNTANSPVFIKSVMPENEFTLVRFTDGPVLPNQNGEIKLLFHSQKGQKGKVKEKLIIKLSTLPENMELIVTGMVFQQLDR